MHAAYVLSEVLFPREAGAGAARAVEDGAEQGFFFEFAIRLVDFAFMAQEAAAVGEAVKFLAAFDVAFVGTVVLVHVLAVTIVSMESMMIANA